MNASAVAVITRTKNRGLLLERAITSVLGQSVDGWHHVIVNDGGDSSAVELLLDKYRDDYRDRLTVLHHPESKGMEAASNAGIKASSSKYVVIHDDDDSWHPEFLQRCLQELEQSKFPSVKGVLTHTMQIFERIENGQVIEERRHVYDPHLVAISLPMITEINRFLPISFLYERSVLDEIGLYDETLPVIGDWEFNIRYFAKYDVKVIRESLANYHVRTDAGHKYANSVTAEKSDHIFYRSLIVNKYIRRDLQHEKVSLGSLLALGDYFYRTSGSLARVAHVLDKLKELGPVRIFRRWFKS